jgi:hypothetical protein
MTEKTCAACDCELDVNPIEVRIGKHVVEVCCDDCARKLGESSREPPLGVEEYARQYS